VSGSSQTFSRALLFSLQRELSFCQPHSESFPIGWEFLGLIGGVSAAALLVAIVFAINAFIMTAYHTCLYLWAVEYERATAPEQVVVPAPLAVALA